ncbi:MAG TPA: copper resistance protein CopC [Mycobacteriales bacterium]|nr:copper resistance protein CopC [Mycobacteriales bacterium]
MLSLSWVPVARRTMAVLAMLLALLVVWAAPAAAHASLLQTTPADGAVLGAAPRELTLLFSEPVGTSLGAIKVIAPNGARADTASVRNRDDGREVVAPLDPDLPEGTYLVVWRVVSEDGHPITGSSIFSIGRESTVAAADGLGGGSVAGRALGFSRLVAFVGLVLLLGVIVFRAFVDPLRDRKQRLLRLVTVGTAAALVGTVAAFLLQGPYGAGESLSAALRPALLRAVAGTRFGVAMAARLVLVVVLGLALWHWIRRGARWSGVVAGVAGGAAALTTAVSGHAGVGELAWAAVPLDALHLTAAGAWVGGLVILVGVVLSGGGPDDWLGRVLTRWSRLAATAVGVLIVTGLFASWREVQELPALPRTTYGHLLIGKTQLVLGMLTLAMVGRAFVQRHNAGSEAPVAQLRRSVSWEAGVAALVLAVTTALVETTPARSTYSPPFVAQERAGEDLDVMIRMAPARAGINTLTVTVTAPDGTRTDVPEVSARLEHSGGAGHDAGSPNVVTVALLRVSAGRYEQPRLVLPMPGTWQLELSVRTSEIDASTLVMDVRVR